LYFNAFLLHKPKKTEPKTDFFLQTEPKTESRKPVKPKTDGAGLKPTLNNPSFFH
jgi:hypothetical protein